MDESYIKDIVKNVINDQLNTCTERTFSAEEMNNDAIQVNAFIELVRYIRTHFNNLIRERDDKIKNLQFRLKHQESQVEQEELKVAIDDNEQSKLQLLILS